MSLLRRSLFAKIFLWFCLTAAISTALVLLAASITGSQPFGRRWMAMTQDLYAHSAVDFYTTAGAPALRKFLDTIEAGSAIEGHLLSAAGNDVLGTPFPEHTRRVYARTLASGISSARLGRYWTAASLITAPDGQRYIFVMEAHPLRGFLDGTFFYSLAPRLIAGLLLAALFCLLLARHITRPISILEAATARMARGDLAVRTLPSMVGRTDELASMAAAFDSMAERIETLLLTQRQMLADVSHELRSPLTRVGVSLELLRRGETDVLETMQSDLDRLNVMIGQILELARFDLQQPDAREMQVDLHSILEDIVDSANHEGRQQKRSVHLLSSGTFLLTADEPTLHSCFENIVRNALHYSPAGSTINVTLKSTDPGSATITVDDDGPGVPQHSLEQIFTPFFRVPGSSQAHPSGSGLGLSISSRIVTRYGGTISAGNRLPHGLSVRVILPSFARTV